MIVQNVIGDLIRPFWRIYPKNAQSVRIDFFVLKFRLLHIQRTSFFPLFGIAGVCLISDAQMQILLSGISL